MNYTDIFNDVVSIMKNDSSTCNDMGAGDYQKYVSRIRYDMPEEEFTFLVNKYLVSFGLEGHLYFRNTNMGTTIIELS